MCLHAGFATGQPSLLFWKSIGIKVDYVSLKIVKEEMQCNSDRINDLMFSLCGTIIPKIDCCYLKATIAVKISPI